MTFMDERDPPPEWGGKKPPSGEGTPIAKMWPGPIDLESLSERDPELPKFIIRDWLPAGYATLMAGHGGVGKSGIALHQSVCLSLGIPFFGVPCEKRRVKYLSCEDRENVLHWRLSRICAYEGISLTDLIGNLDLIDLVGRDTTLWHPNGHTPAFEELAHTFNERDRQVLYVDGISDTFAGNENAKVDVKRYVNQLISLIDPQAGAVVLIGHVSKPSSTAGASGDGYSGTTGWHNSVRARWYLYPESKFGEEGEEKTGSLVLDLQKSNLGAVDQSMKFSWNAESHMFVGAMVGGESRFERSHRERLERAGIMESLSASTTAGVRVPIAVQGRRTAYHVLSVRAEFPQSLINAVKRFNRMVMELRQSGDITTALVKTGDRKMAEVLIPKPVRES